jgi:glycosyltransferase involved in cell wall biosynthesis
MSADLRISAVVPAYNVEKYVVEAIDSLLNQTERFFEIVVVDDGSTDGTAALLDRYRGAAGVKIIRTENKGIASARNAGLAQTSGDYVYFFDSDDLLNEDFVASMRALLAGKRGVDVVYFSGESFLNEGFRTDYRQSYDRKQDGEYASGVEATGSMLRRDAYFSMPCMYLSKRAFWLEHKLSFMDILHEDEELIMRLSCGAGKSLCLSKVFYKRRIRPQSTMMLPKTERNAAGYLRTLESIASYCEEHAEKVAPILPELARRFYTIYFGYLAICKAGGPRPDYRGLLSAAIKLGRFPGLGQVCELWISPDFLAKLSGARRRS